MVLNWRVLSKIGICGILSACSGEVTETELLANTYLYVWQHDLEGDNAPNFISVINADPDSEGYGTLVTTVPAPGATGHAHHTSLVLPSSEVLFANDFRGNSSFIFDASNPLSPSLSETFQNKGEYNYAHTFSELANGNMLTVFQTKRRDDPQPGGLVELTIDGNIVQTGDADNGDPSLFMRPYGLTIAPDINRAMTTNSDMFGTEDGTHVQVWELSSLSLLATLELPEISGPRRPNPYESRLLADGKTVMFNTLSCGLFVLGELDDADLEVKFVYDFEGAEICALPHRTDNYWLQAVFSRSDPSQNAIIVLDISDPLQPEEVSRLPMGEGFMPHWLSPDKSGTRLVLTGYGDHLSRRILMLDFDAATATLSVDPAFGTGDEYGPGFMLDEQVWPHGGTCAVMAHGSVFWPPAAPDWK